MVQEIKGRYPKNILSFSSNCKRNWEQLLQHCIGSYWSEAFSRPNTRIGVYITV